MKKAFYTIITFLMLVGFTGFALAAPPDAPTITSIVPSDKEVTITWSAPNNGGSPITGYTITYSPLPALDWNIKDVGKNTRTITIDQLKNDILYSFSVQATNTDGTSEHSESKSVKPQRIVPGIPKGFDLDVGIDGRVLIKWQVPHYHDYNSVHDKVIDDGGSRITGYNIYYKSNNIEKSFTTKGIVYDQDGTIKQLQHIHEPVPNKTYQYRIAAINANGEGEKTKDKTASITHVNNSNSPKNLKVIPSGAAVRLSWDAVSEYSGNYTIFYNLTNTVPTGNTDSDIQLYRKLQTDKTSIDINLLLNGKEYKFIVSSSGNYSKYITATPENPKYRPNTPTGLTATSGDMEVKLEWNSQSKPVTKYIIYYKQTSDDVWSIHRGGITGTTAIVQGLLNGFDYQFKVKAVNGIEESAFSSIEESRPYGFVQNLNLDIDYKKAKLSWDKPFNVKGDVNYYRIFYRESGENWNLHTASHHKQNITIKQLTPNTSYDFKICANYDSISQCKITSGTTSKTVPDIPLNFKIEAFNQSLKLSWKAPNNNGSPIIEYVVNCLGKGDDAPKNHITTRTLHTFGDLENGKEYRCTVYAKNEIGAGNYTEPIIEIPYYDKADAPKSVTLSVGWKSVTLSWEAVPGVSKYNIEKNVDLSTKWVKVTTTSETSITINGLVNAASHQFRIFPVDKNGQGVPIIAAYVGKNPMNLQGEIPFPGKPNKSTLSISKIGKGEITLQWTIPDNIPANHIRYDIQYKHPEQDTWQTFSKNYADTKITINKLSSFTHEFRIVAKAHPINPWLEGSVSTSSNIVIGTPKSHVLDAPVLSFDDINAELIWSTVESISEYVIEYTNDGLTWKIYDTVDTNSKLVRGLDSNTCYTFRVYGVNSDTVTKVSNHVDVISCESSLTPINLQVTPGPNQVTLSWTRPTITENIIIHDYIIQYKKLSEETHQTFNDGVNTNTSVTITNLQPVSHVFLVYTETNNGFSYPASIIATPLFSQNSESQNEQETKVESETKQSETKVESETKQSETKVESETETKPDSITLTLYAFDDSNNNAQRDDNEILLSDIMILIYTPSTSTNEILYTTDDIITRTISTSEPFYIMAHSSTVDFTTPIYTNDTNILYGVAYVVPESDVSIGIGIKPS